MPIPICGGDGVSEEDDYLEGIAKGILMGYCEGCSHAYPLEDMDEHGLCDECVQSAKEQADYRAWVNRGG
jgi:hypothetical protein